MATDAEDDDPKVSSRDDGIDAASDSDLSSPSSEDESPATPTEWLATSRAKRSTAGNRMKSMLAQEGAAAAADDDLELLFAEADGEDGGFTDDDKEDASDVQMDSSSDEEDQENGDADDLAGEKELERQAREEKKRRLANKRKAADALVPAKFRKKKKTVRIEEQPTRGTSVAGSASPAPTNLSTPTSAAAGPSSSTTAPKPRPKRKSERTSWLPTAADMPTRASGRQTTMLSKELLHERMKQDDARRKRQAEIAERKAKKAVLLAKPPMTQADRLAEAAEVEKRNAKSLNRWEEAEKQREEERMRKIAALHSRKLDGPVVSFWSGALALEGGQQPKHAGLLVAMEEKAPRKKRDTKADRLAAQSQEIEAAKSSNSQSSRPPESADGLTTQPMGETTLAAPPTTTTAATAATTPAALTAGANTPAASTPAVHTLETSTSGAAIPGAGHLGLQTSAAPTPPQSRLAPPMPAPVVPSAPHFEAPHPPPSSSGVLAAPVLAPPMMGAPGMLGGQIPVLSFPSPGPSSNVLAPPNTSSHSPSPLSTKAAISLLPPTPSNLAAGVPQPAKPAEKSADKPASIPSVQPMLASPQQPQQEAPNQPPQNEAEAEPNKDVKVAKFCILLQDFDDDALKDKQVVTKILFGRKMLKLAKPAHAPLCAITRHPAKYRDPRTGIPYANSYAYKEIQRLLAGEYKYSKILGAWVGSGTEAAKGVPERFLNPDGKRSTPLPVPVPVLKDGSGAVVGDKGKGKEVEAPTPVQNELQPSTEQTQQPQLQAPVQASVQQSEQMPMSEPPQAQPLAENRNQPVPAA